MPRQPFGLSILLRWLPMQSSHAILLSPWPALPPYTWRSTLSSPSPLSFGDFPRFHQLWKLFQLWQEAPPCQNRWRAKLPISTKMAVAEFKTYRSNYLVTKHTKSLKFTEKNQTVLKVENVNFGRDGPPLGTRWSKKTSICPLSIAHRCLLLEGCWRIQSLWTLNKSSRVK